MTTTSAKEADATGTKVTYTVRKIPGKPRRLGELVTKAIPDRWEGRVFIERDYSIAGRPRRTKHSTGFLRENDYDAETDATELAKSLAAGLRFTHRQAWFKKLLPQGTVIGEVEVVKDCLTKVPLTFYEEAYINSLANGR